MIFNLAKPYVTRAGFAVLMIDTSEGSEGFAAQIALPTGDSWFGYNNRGVCLQDASKDIMTSERQAKNVAEVEFNKISEHDKDIITLLYRHKSRIAAVRYVRERCGLGLRLATLVADRVCHG